MANQARNIVNQGIKCWIRSIPSLHIKRVYAFYCCFNYLYSCIWMEYNGTYSVHSGIH
jgi:hypothetical protein